MSAPQVRGITGVLDGILSPPAKPADVSSSLHPATPGPDQQAAHTEPSPANPPDRPSVRRGRPPGKAAANRLPKEKMTVWIERTLVDAYRDWTWHARCQLSHLVERALIAYHEQNHRR